MSRGYSTASWAVVVLAGVVAIAALAHWTAPAVHRDGVARERLRVCADPNNLPFSNRRGEGFENRIAQLLAAELGRVLEYTWWPQRRGFFRHTLEAGVCDLVIGVPAQFDRLLTTRPYYASSYVFVTRQADRLALGSLHDPLLPQLRIGVHAIGDDYASIPPLEVLTMQGVALDLHGYRMQGDYSQADPPRALVDALVADEIDVAIAWGPFAGYFARHAPVPLQLTLLPPSDSTPRLPMSFSIAMGLRRTESALAAQVDAALERRQREVRAVLAEYGVPVLEPGR